MSMASESAYLDAIRQSVAPMPRPVPVLSPCRFKRWKREEVEHVMAMYGIKSASQLGRKFGVSRNAITGVWDRAKKRGDLQARRIRSHIRLGSAA